MRTFELYLLLASSLFAANIGSEHLVGLAGAGAMTNEP